MLSQLKCIIIFLMVINVSAQEDMLKISTIPNDLKDRANAVLRLEDFNVSIESRTSIKFNYTRVISVLNESGNSLINAYMYYDDYRKISNIAAFIYDIDGNEIKKIKKKDFIDHSAVDGSTLYSDSRVLFMNYEPHTYPYTVKFSFEMESPNTAAIPSWSPIDSYYLSIENSKISIVDHSNLGLRFKELNFDGFSLEKNQTESSLSYNLYHSKAMKPEDLSPELSSITPKLLVAVNKFHYNGVDGEAANWDQFGKWMNNSLLKGRDIVSQETKEKILDITKNIDDPIEKAKKVYQFVQNNTRYISVQVGIGGIQPISALEVDKLKYGDCKGLTNYTQSLLKVAGVDSYYCVVEAGDSFVNFDEDFPTLEQGNHIILAIPKNNDLIWLDCTSQIHPFGFIGDFTDNRDVLVVQPNGSQILKTSSYLNEVNKQITNATITLNEDASIIADLDIKNYGIQYDRKFFIEKESDDDVKDFYKHYWGYLNNLNFNNYRFQNDKNEVIFNESLKLEARNYLTQNGDEIILIPNIFNRNTFIPSRYRKRTMPVLIQRGYLDEDYYTIQLPDNYEIISIPSKTTIKNKYGEYEYELLNEGNILKVNRKLLIKDGSYPKEEYSAYRDFRKEISKHDKSIVILKPKTN